MLNHSKDTLAEWLRRRPAKPMGSPRVGSNPTGVDLLHWFAYHGGHPDTPEQPEQHHTPP